MFVITLALLRLSGGQLVEVDTAATSWLSLRTSKRH